MAKYIIQGNITEAGTFYQPGSEIELTEERAKQLGNLVKPKKAKEKPAPESEDEKSGPESQDKTLKPESVKKK